MFHSGADGLEWVRAKLEHGGPATLAVSSWGAGAVKALGLTDRDEHRNEVRIICNLVSGFTDPAEVQLLQHIRGVSVVQCDSIHGKVYLFENAAMIGSSNVSSNTQSIEGPNAVEICDANIVTYELSDVSAVAEWINGLSTREVTPGDLHTANKTWKTRRQALPSARSNVSVQQILEDHEPAFAGLDVHLVLTKEGRTDEAEVAIKEMRKEYATIDAWEDWDDLPEAGKFISFHANDSGAFVYENCFRRDPNIPDRPQSQDAHSLQFCLKHPLPLGLMNPTDEGAVWGEIIKMVSWDPGMPENRSGLCVKFEDLAILWANRARGQ